MHYDCETQIPHNSEWVVCPNMVLQLPLSMLSMHAHKTFWKQTFLPLQFVVYSGYYYFLTLLFIGAGVYSLTSTGWMKSLRFCCHEQQPPSLAGPDEGACVEGGPCKDRPLIQDESKIQYTRTARETSVGSSDKPV